MLYLPIGFILTASLLVLPDANPTLFFYEKLLSSSLLSQPSSPSSSDKNIYASKFKDKRVWITGASSGIGEEIAKQLFHHGAKVILSGRRIDELKRVGQSCSPQQQQQGGVEVENEHDTDDSMRKGNSGGSSISSSASCNSNYSNIQLLPFDITNSDDDLSNIVKTAINYYDGIDILILNAGVGQLSPAIDESFDKTRYLMEVNFHSPVRLAMEVMKQDQWGSNVIINGNDNGNDNGKIQNTIKKKKKKEGHIVLTSSVASKLPLPLGTSYAASKHAAHGYFSSLRTECNPWLRVDLPCPGPIDTSFQTKATSVNNNNNSSSNMKADNDEIDKDDSTDNSNDDVHDEHATSLLLGLGAFNGGVCDLSPTFKRELDIIDCKKEKKQKMKKTR